MIYIKFYHEPGDVSPWATFCGALLGAVYGLESIPKRWVESIEQCRPDASDPRVRQPRPECFWPNDALTLAEKLLMRGKGA